MKTTVETTKMILKNNNYIKIFIGVIGIIAGGAFARYAWNNQQQPDIVFMIILALMFILVGIQILLTRKSELILIDKEAGKIILTNLSIIKKESKEVQLSEIKKLILEITTLERRRRGTIYYRYEIELIQEEGRTIFELGRTGRVQTGVATPDQKMIDQAKQIAEFVGVPFECTLPLDTDYIPRELKEKMGLMQNETK